MGFVKLNTDLKSWAWINEPKTVYVYVRLLLGAAWADMDVGNVHLRRGEIAISQRDFAERCSVTRQELRTAISRLIATHRITQRTEHKYSIITLCDYDCEATAATQMSTQNQPDNNPIATQYQPNNNPPTLLNKKDKNIRNPETAPAAREGGVLSEYFDKFWSAYPKKTAKQSALKAFEKLKPDEELLTKMLSSLEQQKKSVQWTKDNGQYIPYPATWLNGRRWEDEPEKTQQEVNKNGKNFGYDSMPKTKAEWLEGFRL